MNATNAPATFIGGFRSGSTLLINLLGLHPELAPWFETKFICEALRWQRVREDPQQGELERQLMQPTQPSGYALADVVERMELDMRATAARLGGRLRRGKASHERYPIGDDCIGYPLADAQTALQHWRRRVAADGSSVYAATGELVNHLGERHARSRQRALWVNKTPEIPRFGTELRRSLGDCRIILMIRDGRQVALSSRRLNAGSVETIATWWKGLIQQSRAANPVADRYLEVRYEDLTRDPAQVLDRICGFLKLPALGDAITAEYRRQMGAKAFRRPFRVRWRKLRGGERRAFDRIAGDLSAELGYR